MSSPPAPTTPCDPPPRPASAGPPSPAGAPAVPQGRAFSNAAWTMSGHVAMQAMRFAGNLILTRLLFPEAFGLMALVNVLLQGLYMLSDVSLGPCVVQSRRGDDPDFLNTAWTLGILRGAVLWVLATALAWPLAAFYGEPQLLPVTAVLAFTTFLTGFTSTATHTLNRNLLRARLVIMEVGVYAASLTLMTAWVWWHPTVWALVGGTVFSCVAQVALSHVFLPGIRNRLHWDRAAAWEIFSFGRWIFLSTGLAFVTGQFDRPVIGGLFGMATLGIYNLGAHLAGLPAGMLSGLIDHLVFPLCSRLHRNGADLSAGYARIHLIVALPAAAGVTAMMVAGPAAVQVLYDSRYHAAGEVLQVLAAGIWFVMIQGVANALLMATGRSRLVAAANLGKLAGLMVLVPAGWWAGGWHGLLLGIVGADVCKYLVTAWAVRREAAGALRHDLVLSVLIAVVALSATEIAALSSVPTQALTQLVCRLLVVALMWSAVAAAWWAGHLLRNPPVPAAEPVP